MKSSTGRTTAATRSLAAIQMPSGMPNSRLITVAAMISASVLIVAGQNPVAMMTKNEAAQNRPNFQPTRHSPSSAIAPATSQCGRATRPCSIASVKPAITWPKLSNVPLSCASTKLMNWLTHSPIGIASCIAGLLVAQALQQDRLGYRAHVDAVAVDHRKGMRVARHPTQHLAERAGAGQRRHVRQQGIGHRR